MSGIVEGIKKLLSSGTGANESDRPDVKIQKQLLEQKRAELRQQGFLFEMQAIQLKAQTVSIKEQERDRLRKIEEAQENAANAYAGAREFDRMLKDLDAAEKVEDPAAAS